MAAGTGRKSDKMVTAGSKPWRFIAKSIATLAIAGIAFGITAAAAATTDVPSSPGPNFNMTVPPIVVEQPAPTPDVASQAPAQEHPDQTQAPAADTTVAADPTSPVTAAPLPDCPTDGSTFAYGSCNVPNGVTDSGAQPSFGGAPIASPGAPSKVCVDSSGKQFTCPANMDQPDGVDRTQDVPSSVDDTTGTTVVGGTGGAQGFHAS